MQGKGFLATYTQVESRCGGVMRGAQGVDLFTISIYSMISTYRNISTCAGVLTSPNYPSNYDSDDDCGWLLEVDTNHVVQLAFEDFDVEPHSNCRCLLSLHVGCPNIVKFVDINVKFTNCSYDHVAVYDGNSTAAPLLLLHCGRELPAPALIKSTSNQVTLTHT